MVQISPAYGPNTYQIIAVARKSFNGKFAIRIAFPIVHFKLPLLTLALEVVSLVNRIIENIHNYELFGKKKNA